MTKAIPTVEDFEKLQNEMGLVPMRHLTTTVDTFKGSIRGYAPETALMMYQREQAEPYNAKVEPTGSTAEEASADTGTGDDSLVKIPADWQDGSALIRTRLAKKISGRSDSMNSDEANAIIAAEEKRQAQLGPNAVQSNQLPQNG